MANIPDRRIGFADVDFLAEEYSRLFWVPLYRCCLQLVPGKRVTEVVLEVAVVLVDNFELPMPWRIAVFHFAMRW